MTKKTKEIIGCVLACSIGSGIIAGIQSYQEKKERDKYLEASWNQKRKKWDDELSKIHKDTEDTFDILIKSLKESADKEKLRNTKRLVMYLYLVIKKRTTLMKSEQDWLLAAVRENKLVDGIDLEKVNDQELLRYLETKCKFEVIDSIPYLTSLNKKIKFMSLKVLDLNLDEPWNEEFDNNMKDLVDYVNKI